ncbi:MAG: sigma-70 family RNA polymerase sigma factor [Sphingobacterium sp.]|jgi:RNA polymerase sigma-70 factor (ECF subfamily)|uniref:RNA polymerase sigma factor n=1 Tax=Sphingobacterium sp. TaxID=341027 RepID=UPI002827CF7E|nr:sigma-70 family RNA polymerase sigma factor [Sphingobacterium sp.]MDR0261789.1 sigma-70 family RNA polymerase sigma factor [Sphingobacterium sp.]MDR3010212.1 sigma-70 family RNA polymerase sigma factor [Sphingobacterium sp.]
MTDSQLIDSLKTDGQEGFVAIYRKFYKQLLFFILGYLKENRVAEEIVADVFVKVWERRSDFHTMENLKAFIYISAKNASLNVIRSERSKGIHESLTNYEDLLADDRDVFSKMIHAELIHSIFIEVVKLPEKQREVFNMTYLEDKTVEEIAEELQMSPTAVYTNRSRAIHTIRTLLGTKNALTLLAFLSLVGEN